jgi:hypothetical protein
MIKTGFFDDLGGPQTKKLQIKQTKRFGTEPLCQWTRKPFPQGYRKVPSIGGVCVMGGNVIPEIEKQMKSLSSIIRAYPNWFMHLNNLEFISSWKQKGKEMGLDEETITFVFEELNYYKERICGTLEVSAVDGVWQADQLIDENLKITFLKNLGQLEVDSRNNKNPDLDIHHVELVDPSLFMFNPYVSRVVNEDLRPTLSFLGKGKVEQHAIEREMWDGLGKSLAVHQWLPAEFILDAKGRVKIDSYINNLHPIKHRELYKSIGKIFEKFVPLFEKMLTDLVNPRPPRTSLIRDEDLIKRVWTSDEEDTYDVFDEESREQEESENEEWISDDDEESGEDDDDSSEELIPRFISPSEPIEIITLSGYRLQVIVQLINYELFPSHPVYKWDNTRVEGLMNENIVATGIYPYSSENVQEPTVQFSQTLCDKYNNINDDTREFLSTLGVDDFYEVDLGKVSLKQDRCFAYPNHIIREWAPLELQDQTKPGYFKFIKFFLVDPALRIVSTANVPPQQEEWFMEELKQIPFFQQLPRDIFALIKNNLEWPMSFAQARKYRKERLQIERNAVEDICLQNCEHCY